MVAVAAIVIIVIIIIIIIISDEGQRLAQGHTAVRI